MPSVEVIAEAAQGYAGSADKQRFLVRAAKAAAADSIKFQLVYADELATPGYEHYATFERSEMPVARWLELAESCRAEGIQLYLDVFGERSLATALDAGAGGVKLHSSGSLNLALIDAVAKAPVERVVLSTGGGHQGEIQEAASLLSEKKLTLMHGFQGYPTQNEDNQIGRLRWLADRFPEHDVGFADHAPANDPRRLWLAAVAVGCGATVVEKHLTTALALRELDHDAALSPDEFAIYVANVHDAADALGASTGPWPEDFGMSASETGYRTGMKKQVVAGRNLDAGHTLVAEDLNLKRTPSTDGVIFDVRAVIGRTLAVEVRRDEPLTGRAFR